MIWLAFLGLCVWVLVQQQRSNIERAKLARLIDQVARLAPGPAAPAAPAPATPTAMATVIAMAPPPPALTPVAPKPTAAIAAPARTESLSRRSALEWLSENGLAWLGGGALALGGLLLVAYAAEHGFFTPPMRVISAAALGLVAIGIGEWLRRQRTAAAPQDLVAALVTAAGAAILYASIWAAHTLYGFIPAVPAALLLTVVSIGLVGAAFLHGQAMGLLGVLMAFAVPAVSGGGRWNDGPLDAYLLLIATTGTVVAASRNWAGVAAVTLAGLGLWTIYKLGGGDGAGTALMATAATALMLAVSAYRRRDERGPPAADDPFAILMMVACILSSLAALVLYFRAAGHAPLEAALVVAALAGLIAWGVKRGLAPALLLLAPATVAVLWAAVTPINLLTADAGHIGWLLAALVAVGASGLHGGLTAKRGLASATIGAGACVLGLVLLWRVHPLEGFRGAVPAAFALLLAAGAAALGGRAETPQKDPATGAWIFAAAAAAALFLTVTLDGRAAPSALALLGLGLALAGRRLSWQGFAQSAAFAGLASFAAILAPAITAAALSGRVGWSTIALAAGAASAVQGATWWVLKAQPHAGPSAETASSAAVLSGLLGAFLVLRTLALPGGQSRLIDPLTEASLRTILIIAAGLLLAVGAPTSLWGRIRASSLLGIGALHGLLAEAMFLHPWWGLADRVGGPPILDSVLLGLLAPALLLAEAGRRLRRDAPRVATTAASVALVFLLLWILTEIRRLFHGPLLAQGPFGFSEVATYGLAVAGTALAFEQVRDRLTGLGFPAAFGLVLGGLVWLFAAVALWLLGVDASPWWGPIAGVLRSPALFFVTYGAACGLAGLLAAAATRAGRVVVARAATAAAGVEVFALLTIAVRFAFHGAAMRAPLRETSLETWTFSAVWALYGLMVLATGAGRRAVALRWLGLAILLGTTAKVFLFDMARLEGVIRAGSFLALGILLLVGALAARRFARPATVAR